jgi:hypothetical protein
MAPRRTAEDKRLGQEKFGTSKCMKIKTIRTVTSCQPVFVARGVEEPPN